jgi:hypothetical protein
MTVGRPLAAIVVLAGALTGCSSNAATFYEGTRFAFVTEYNPASGEPVNLTLGYKRRIAAVVPPQTSTTDPNLPHKGETLSLVSTFEVEPGAVIGDGVIIRNIFASGMAAQELTKDNAEENVTALFAASSLPDLSAGALDRRDKLLARFKTLGNDQAKAILQASGLAPKPPRRCSRNNATEARCTLKDTLSRADENDIGRLQSAFDTVAPR